MENHFFMIGGIEFELTKYAIVMGAIMLLELIYIGMLTAYVANFRRQQGFISTVHIDKLFMVWHRSGNGVHLQGVKG